MHSSFHSTRSLDTLNTLGSACTLTVFPEHESPQPRTRYFTANTPSSGAPPSPAACQEQLLVCVPTYNEPSKEMMHTLTAIYDQTRNSPNLRVSVLVIVDGWAMAAPSMKNLLSALMGGNCVVKRHSDWTTDSSFHKGISQDSLTSGQSSPRTPLQDLRWMNDDDSYQTPIVEAVDGIYIPGEISTVVLENVDPESQEVVPVQIAPGKMLELTVLVKLDNRRKHNSHKWFLSGFAEAHRATATYLLLTDTGTFFSPNCLSKLTGLLRENPSEYCAAIAFQRPVVTGITKSFMSMVIGLAQRYEFYMQNYGAASACALFGFQPVIPGPCQLLTAEAGLNPKFQQMYYEIGDKRGAELSFLEANMQLAEDRFFTNFLFVANGKKIGFVPSAVFHYDLEVDPESFLMQRRRWVLGTIASSFSLLHTFPVWSRQLPLGRAIGVFMFMIWYTFCLVSSSLVPGMLGASLFQSVGRAAVAYYGGNEDEPLPLYAMAIAAPIALIFFASLFAFTIIHHTKSFVRPLYMFCVYYTAASTTLVFAYSAQRVLAGGGTVVAGKLLGLTGLMFSYPGIMSVLIGDWQGLIWGSVTFIAYFLFRTKYVIAHAYCIAQSWNISWGTRPVDENSPMGKENQQTMLRNHRASRKLVTYYLAGNTLAAVIGVIIAAGHVSNILLYYNLFFIVPSCAYYPFGALYFAKEQVKVMWRWVHHRFVAMWALLGLHVRAASGRSKQSSKTT